MANHQSEDIRHSQVLNATLNAICLYGIEKITLDRIAEAAGCSKGVIAYYFKTKSNVILQAYKAFLGYYSLKTQEGFGQSSDLNFMLDTLIDVALPPRSEASETTLHAPINVFDTNALAITEYQEAFLFMQFFTAALTHPQLQTTLIQAYASDATGIATLFSHCRSTLKPGDLPNLDLAYGFLAMVVGLSFFRVTKILGDDRHILKSYLDHYQLFTPKP